MYVSSFYLQAVARTTLGITVRNIMDFVWFCSVPFRFTLAIALGLILLFPTPRLTLSEPIVDLCFCESASC